MPRNDIRSSLTPVKHHPPRHDQPHGSTLKLPLALVCGEKYVNQEYTVARHADCKKDMLPPFANADAMREGP